MYIFFASYVALPLVNSVVQGLDKAKHTYLTSNSNLYEFFTAVKADAILLPQISDLYGFRNLVKLQLYSFDYTRELILFDRTYVYDGLYLSRKWAKNRGKVTFYLGGEIGKKYLVQSFTDVLVKVALNYYFNLRFDIVKHGGNLTYRPTRHSLLEAGYNLRQKSDLKENWEIFTKNMSEFKNFNLSNRSVFISQGELSMYVSESSFKEVQNFLETHKSDICLKQHPRHYLGIGDTCDLPTYLPAELIINLGPKNIISVFSTVLTRNYHDNKTKRISILELLEWKDEQTKESIKADILEKDNRILFVKDYQQLKTLITV